MPQHETTTDELTLADPDLSDQGDQNDPPVRMGRPRDHTRDAVILDAALDVLAENGYERMTVDMVATRAQAGKATLYRRWSSKPELVLDAVARMIGSQVDLEQLPDTGTLRGDLLGLFNRPSLAEVDHMLKVMSGLGSMLSQNKELAEMAHAAVVEPWATVLRVLIARAAARGEIRPPAHVDTLVQVIPSMAVSRALLQRKSFDSEFLVSLVDGVLLPALHTTDHG